MYCLVCHRHSPERAGRLLSQDGYLKEFKNTKPFHYELLRKKPNQLSLLENINDFEAVWLERCKRALNAICATGQRLNTKKITVEGDLEKQGVSGGCTVAQMPLTRKTLSSGRKEQATLTFPKSHNETSLKSEKTEEGEKNE